MKNPLTLRNDSSYKGNFAVYDEDYRSVWTPRKYTTDVIHWISSDNPAKISHNYT